jgi:hypothetical protein
VCFLQHTRFRLSDKTSRLRPRRVAPQRGQAYEPEVPVKVREWTGPAPASPDFVLMRKPPAQPHSGVVVPGAMRTGAVRRIDALGHYAFGAEPAGVVEHQRLPPGCARLTRCRR